MTPASGGKVPGGEGHAGNLQAGPTAARPTYRLIQVLRAVAALMVVAHHATIMLRERANLPIAPWINGGAGVDLFFVISGFVMTISSAPLLRTAHPARTFMARRLERVVPLYWIATTIKILTVLAAPALAVNALGTPWHVIASYLFLFTRNSQQTFHPPLVVGWTLNFEMMFYVLFACALALRVVPWKFLTPAIAFIALARFIPQTRVPGGIEWYENGIVVEFLFGVFLGYALPSVKKLPPLLAAALGLGGFAVLFLWAWPDSSYFRFLQWGLAAVAVIIAALALEARWGQRAPRWLLELGDASYSIYLVHTFVLPVIGILLIHLGTRWVAVVPFALLVSVLFSTLCGEIVYRSLERPVTQWFKGRRQTAVPANT